MALIAARNEAGRVGPCVEAVGSLPAVHEIVVAADGSTDGTPEEARAAGARVLLAGRGVGKGRAMEAALERIDPADVYLFVDGDLGSSAKEASLLLEEVLSGRADLAIGVLPRDPRHGGFRLVKGLAALVIRFLCGFRAAEPLSGQRALRAEVVGAVRPLAEGFGVEVGMTIDAVRSGFRVSEMPVAMEHSPTGRDVVGFVHRGRQGLDLLRAAARRVVPTR